MTAGDGTRAGAAVRRAGPPAGARLVAGGLSFPTSVAFDEEGRCLVAESGLPFGGAPSGGRVWRLDDDGGRTLVAGGLAPPVNGIAVHDGWVYVAEGGAGRISRVDRHGTVSPVLEGLPGPGNYHTNMPAFGPDGRLYFSQGSMTNTGIVGLDAYDLGWLRRLPHAHDLPAHDLVLTGVNARTRDPLGDDPDATVETGAFAPFGTATRPRQVVAAALPCTAAVMRCDADGGGLELVTWGLRNAYGIGFLPDGRLLAIDQGADDRGSRPVGNAPDCLYEVRPGAWYGWPDFIAGDPITDPAYRPTRGRQPTFVIANHQDLPAPERPLLRFAPHAAAVKFAVAPPGTGPWAGHLFVALFGDEAPMTAPGGERVGREVVRVDPENWTPHPFPGPELSRPIDVAFDPSDPSRVYVLDFGRFEMEPGRGVVAEPGSGGLWRHELELSDRGG